MIELLNNHPFFADKDIASCTLLENQGYCNENTLVVANGVKYIVRKLLRDDIDRELEWKVQNLAFKEGITTEPLVFDRENGFMVFAFLAGVHKTTLGTNELETLAQTLRKLHNIHIEAQPIKLQIDSSPIKRYPKDYVLCHNDLNPNNIFFSKNIKFIDWEYAGVNDRYFDLACVCVEFNLGVGMQEVFLKSYFEGEYSLEKLEAYKVIYKTLCEKWFKDNP
jgi:thiamine kinase-like enzyme